uniref:Gag-Pol polyprotein n=1 Tax=Tanacetum cinerariifolium TaxID=118510 RepID=A0A6L2K7S0_TANCI|nr:hypothetical protein [Tanacetum cinerariifolium]
MDEFDKFAAKEGESLESMHERLTTLVNIMDRNNVRPILVSINTKKAGRQNRNQAFNAGNGLTQNDESHYARDCQKPRVRDAKYFREQMLLAMKYEAGSNLKDEENDFMLDNSYGDETLEELTAAVIMMARIQLADDNAVTEPPYDAKAVSEVYASHKMIPKGVEHKNHGKREAVINTSDNDQIDSNIIFDDPYVKNNSGTSEHDSNAHEEYHDIQILSYNVQREAENKKRLNNELKKQKELLQKELERSGLGYQNPERLKKAIAAQPKMYYGEMLQSTKLKINSLNSEETLEDMEESRLKMRSKMVQLDYEKLNAL